MNVLAGSIRPPLGVVAVTGLSCSLPVVSDWPLLPWPCPWPLTDSSVVVTVDDVDASLTVSRRTTEHLIHDR